MNGSNTDRCPGCPLCQSNNHLQLYGFFLLEFGIFLLPLLRKIAFLVYVSSAMRASSSILYFARGILVRSCQLIFCSCRTVQLSEIWIAMLQRHSKTSHSKHSNKFNCILIHLETLNESNFYKFYQMFKTKGGGEQRCLE